MKYSSLPTTVAKHLLVGILLATSTFAQDKQQGKRGSGNPIALPNQEKPFTLPKLKSSETTNAPPVNFLYNELKFYKIELGLDELFANQFFNIFVLSDGSYVKDMGWFPYVADFLLGRIESGKGEIKEGLILACDGNSVNALVDPSQGKDTGQEVAKARDQIANARTSSKHQECVKLMSRIADHLEENKRGGKIRSLVFLVGTDWNFEPIFSPEKPDKPINRLVKQGIENIWFLQLHHGENPNPSFDSHVIQAAKKLNDKVQVQNIALQKITDKNEKETSPKLIEKLNQLLRGLPK